MAHLFESWSGGGATMAAKVEMVCGFRYRRSAVGLLVGLSLLCLVPQGQCAIDVPAADSRSDLMTTIGRGGVYYLRYQQHGLKVRPPVEDEPLQIQIAEVGTEGEFSVYELRYVADRAGTYDLREYLVSADGQRVDNLHTLPLVIRELLDAKYDGGLWDLQPQDDFQPIRYTLLLVIVVTLWMIPLVWILLGRITSGRARESGQ